MAKSSRPAKTAKNKSTVRNSRTTVSGPAEPDASGGGDIVGEKAAGTQDAAHGVFELIKDQYRHCKPILAVGASDQLLTACGIDTALPNGQLDPGLITTSDASTAGDGFIAAIGKYRHFARETDPPRVSCTARRHTSSSSRGGRHG
jgi:hypothetical protein